MGEAGDYTNTKFAHHGMNGTKLPPMDTGVIWKIGGNVEVAWQASVIPIDELLPLQIRMGVLSCCFV